MARSIESLALFSDDPLSVVYDDQGIATGIEGEFPREELDLFGLGIDPEANHVRFLNTSYGADLTQIHRYQTFLEQTEAWLDGDTDQAQANWRDWFGPDVQGALHEPHTSRIAKFVTERGASFGFTSTDEQMLVFVANHHDKGESIAGDTPYVLKTSAHEDEEAKELAFLLETIYPEYPRELTRATLEAIWPTGGETKLSYTFNAIERIGYLDTAITSLKVAHYEDVTIHDFSVLKGMAQAVGMRHVLHLAQPAEDFPGVAEYLKAKQTVIEAIHQYEPPVV